jgi:hypothetical protein
MKLDKKKKKIFTLLYNIALGGSGTLLYGLDTITENNPSLSLWQKFKHLIFGIIQVIGFVLLIIHSRYNFSRCVE